MHRSVKLSLTHLTTRKRNVVDAVRREYRSAINFYFKSLWDTRGKLDAATLNRYQSGSLGYRQRTDALRYALTTIISTKRAAKTYGRPCRQPQLSANSAVLVNQVKIEPFRGTGFDYMLKLTCFSKRQPVLLPLKSHRRLNYWLNRGATIIQSCNLHNDYVVVSLDIPESYDVPKSRSLGVDVGLNKLLATSESTFFGTKMHECCRRISRCKPKSRSMLRARRARDQYISEEVKKLPWSEIGCIAIENLTGLQKTINTRSWNASTMAPWTYRQVASKLRLNAQENRVRLVAVEPKNTSRRCPNCRTVAKENRVGERFKCVQCNYSMDADTVGALNILDKATGNWQERAVSVSKNGRKSKPPKSSP